MKLIDLFSQVSSICPIVSVNSDGVIEFKDEATEQQRADAQALVLQKIGTLSEPDVRAEILSVSQQALSSGFLHILMFDMMRRYLQEAQQVVPTLTEADLLNSNGPYYHRAYAETKAYYDQLVMLQDQK